VVMAGSLGAGSRRGDSSLMEVLAGRVG